MRPGCRTRDLVGARRTPQVDDPNPAGLMEGDDAYALVDMDAREPWYLALSRAGRHMSLERRGRSHAGASPLIPSPYDGDSLGDSPTRR